MSRLDHSVLHLARFSLEAQTAISIGSGGPDGVYDHPIVRDANGLPMIPGTSLAGVLRHLWIENHGEASAADLFGYQFRGEGAASRLEVAACPIQDSKGRPVEGLLMDAAGGQRPRDDALFHHVLATRDDPLFRDRVRLTHRGVARSAGKFDRGLLAAGHRFSGELRLWSRTKDDRDWNALLDLLGDPRLRLGGATRAGMGAVRLKSLHGRAFDLRDPKDVAAFQQLGSGFADLAGLNVLPLSPEDRKEEVTSFSIQLTPRDFWRFGGGAAPIGDYRNRKTPDLLPKLEPVVTWADGKAGIATRLALVPGSAVKGALAHRMAFHWNTLNGRFVDDMPLDQIEKWDKSEHCEGVRAVFGYAKDRESDEKLGGRSSGQAGHVLIDDASVEVPVDEVQAMIHNSIDRFTGGVRNRMLFTEELVWKRPFELRITLLPGVERAEAGARKALARAIRDLCEGRLALGAGGTKGHGSFTGTPDEAAGRWLAEQEEETR